MPVADILLTFIACYELIQLIISYNNLASFETWFIWKWIFKTFVAGELITHTFDIAMAVFDVSQSVVRQAGEIHAIISNIGNKEYKIKMGQLVIMPVLIPDFTFENWKEHGTGAFGSTGR